MNPIHKNYAKAAKLMLITYAVDGIILLKSFISIFTIDSQLAELSATSNSELTKAVEQIDAQQFKSGIMVSIIFTSLYYILAAHLIQKGYGWVKYVLLIFILLRINNLVGEVAMFKVLETVIDIVVIALEIWITTLLFRVNKESFSQDIPVSPDL